MEERQQELRQLYQKAIEEMPEGKTVVIFWSSNISLSTIQRLKFEDAIDEISGVLEWQYTCNAWPNGYFNHLAIKPANIREQDLEDILRKWIVTPQDIIIEYRQ